MSFQKYFEIKECETCNSAVAQIIPSEEGDYQLVFTATHITVEEEDEKKEHHFQEVIISTDQHVQDDELKILEIILNNFTLTNAEEIVGLYF